MKKYLLALLCTLALSLSACGKQASFHYQDTQLLMDTTISIQLAGSQEEQLKTAADAAFKLWHEIDDETDRFHPSVPNGLFALNHASSPQPFPVGDHLYRLLGLAQEQPHPEFDITLAPLSDLWQAHHKAQTVPTDAELAAALRLCGRDKFKLDLAKHTVTLAPGSKLDVGAIAKGYAVDEAYKLLSTQKGVQSALINAGGNIRVLGDPNNTRQTWRIGIQDPRNPQGLLGTLTLKPGEAVATSGDYQRYYEVDGVRYHHILDPATGKPARTVRSATVLAPTAVHADLFSTLLFVLPPQRALALVEQTPNIKALLVTNEGELLLSKGLQDSFTPTKGDDHAQK